MNNQFFRTFSMPLKSMYHLQLLIQAYLFGYKNFGVELKMLS